MRTQRMTGSAPIMHARGNDPDEPPIGAGPRVAGMVVGVAIGVGR